MTTVPAKPHVLVIGAGLGGLALAQALRKQDIPFDIFERDRYDGERSQGWTLSLHDWLMKDFASGTRDDLPDLERVSTTYALGIPAQAAFFDAFTMAEQARFGGGIGEDFIRADRSKLREWFLSHVNVHWDKRFSHYEKDKDGVTAFFEDGSSYRGDVLCGADGVHSRVRDQLLPDPSCRPKKLPLGIVIGELTATREQYQRWLKIAPSFFICLAGNSRIVVVLKEIASDRKTASYYWMYGWPDENAENDDFWTVNASRHELHCFMADEISGFDPQLAELIHATPVEGMLHPPIQMKDMTPPQLPQGRVTLLGDAVHPMTPFRGEGGNMAMKDGFSLASCLGESKTKAAPEMLKEYENEMIPRATRSVLGSRAAIERPHEGLS